MKRGKLFHNVYFKGIWSIKASATILSQQESCLHVMTFYISNKCANWYYRSLPLAMVVTQVLREA